jgi:hypothetical protein
MSYVETILLSSFLNDQCAPDQFKSEIEAAQQNETFGKIIIGNPEVGFSDVELTLSAEPDAAERTVLLGIAAAHTAAGLADSAYTPDGNLIVAPTFEYTDLDPVWSGYLYKPTAKGAGVDPVYSMFDEPTAGDLRLRGGLYALESEGAELGDMVEFSIVDKDDVLGLFATYGLTQGVDVLELKKFVRTEYVSPTSIGAEHYFGSDGGFRLAGGLYFRSTYISTGAATPDFRVRLSYQE